MKTPILHYDYWIGHNPKWREALVAALQGDSRLIDYQTWLMSGWAPSASHFLDSMYAYAQEGQQTFLVGRKLQQLLTETDAENIPLQFLSFPFDSFYVALEDCPWSLWGGSRTKWHQIGGFYVTRLEPEDGEGGGEPVPRGFRLAIWGPENERSTSVGGDSTQWLCLDLHKAVTREDDDGTQYISIDPWLDKILNVPANDCSDLNAERPQGANRVKNNQYLRNVVHLTVSLLLYLNSAQPDLAPKNGNLKERSRLKKKLRGQKSTKKRARTQRQINQVSQARVVWLGRAVETQPEEPTEQTTTKTGRKVRLHRRRGHWHTYWTGPRKDAAGNPQKGTDTVLKWVAPRWVGADTAEAVTPGTLFKFRVDRDE